MYNMIATARPNDNNTLERKKRVAFNCGNETRNRIRYIQYRWHVWRAHKNEMRIYGIIHRLKSFAMNQTPAALYIYMCPVHSFSAPYTNIHAFTSYRWWCLCLRVNWKGVFCSHPRAQMKGIYVGSLLLDGNWSGENFIQDTIRKHFVCFKFYLHKYKRQ